MTAVCRRSETLRLPYRVATMNGCGSEESRLKRVPKVQGAILFALISQAKGQSFKQITAFEPLFVWNLELNHGNMV